MNEKSRKITPRAVSEGARGDRGARPAPRRGRDRAGAGNGPGRRRLQRAGAFRPLAPEARINPESAESRIGRGLNIGGWSPGAIPVPTPNVD